MNSISVVIVCKNEADIIAGTLQSLAGITDDIVIYDNGSADGTQQVIKQFHVQLHEGTWEGFGKTKNKAIALAKYDWILSLDADEAIDSQLRKALMDLDVTDPKTVFDISFQSFLGKTRLKFGEWGGDHHVRLFNRKEVHWNDAPVHEELIFPANVITKKMEGSVLHYTMKDMEDYSRKMLGYAMLNARKYHQQGKKATWAKIKLSPGFTFFNYYFLKLGFLDGYAGYVCAKMTAWYTFLKYSRLKELNQQSEVGSLQSGKTS